VGESSILTEVRAEKWVYGGDTLARVDGRVILTPFLLPGETARVELGKDIRADLVEVIQPAPERASPPCPYFMRCGGCHYQHAPYELQLSHKREILREQLRRVGKIDYSGEIATVAGPPFGYRNRAQFHIVNGRVGYAAARSHELIPVAECPISSPTVNRALSALIEMARERRFPRFVRTIELFTNEAEIQVNVLEKTRPVAKHFFEWCAEKIPGANERSLDYPACGANFRVSHGSFFQVNRFLIEPLVEAALGEAGGASALDLYAGVGLFSVPLAKRFENVTALEASMSAVRDLQFNAERLGLSVRTHHSRVDEYLKTLTEVPEFVLADPPRAGLGRDVTRELARLKPPRLTIISCDPATLARDIAALGCNIEKLTLVDLFPQTYHIETIACVRFG
jgi:23S rRNA (uracil1939-C5)-methyltransferase